MIHSCKGSTPTSHEIYKALMTGSKKSKMDNYKLITTHPEYWLLVDIKHYASTEDWVITNKGTIFPPNKGFPLKNGITCDKLVAYIKRNESAATLGDLPLLPELPKEEDDVEQLINPILKEIFGTDKDSKIDLKQITHDDLRTIIKATLLSDKASTKKYSFSQIAPLIAALGQIREGKSEFMSSFNKVLSVEDMSKLAKDAFEMFELSRSPTLTPIGFKPEYYMTNPKKLMIIDGQLQGIYY